MTVYAFAIALMVLPLVNSAGSTSQPLLLQADQGERRTRLPLADQPVRRIPTFTIKIDAFNGASRDLVMLTEDFPPGAAIRPHRHLHEDEILYAENGTIWARVGNRVAVLGPHATVFVPHDTWVTIKNVGSQTVRLVAVFDRPGYDAYLRCSSTIAGGTPRPLTKREDNACAERGDVEYGS
jgi:quercetin dioxygenase-like cupin family protein